MATSAQAAFLSYSREDSDFALRLGADLKSAGALVWIDQLDITPSEEWDIAVEEALARSPRMLLILSPASVKSRNVRNEIARALDENKSIIPVLYQNCQVPLQLARVHHIDFTTDYDRGLKTLLKTLVVEQPAAAGGGAAVLAVPKDTAADVPDADERERAPGQERLEQGAKQVTGSSPLAEANRQSPAPSRSEPARQQGSIRGATRWLLAQSFPSKVAIVSGGALILGSVLYWLWSQQSSGRRVAVVVAAPTCGGPNLPACITPSPLLQKGSEVTWWFVFKFNSKVFPGCGGMANPECTFGGSPQNDQNSSQQYVFASNESPTLQQGLGCAGDTINDPIGATFDEIYHGAFHYVVWNDQFYGDPDVKGCGESCGAPWGHSKGIVAWNDIGEGMVMQVSTPSWPAAGSASFPRKSDGNTLGCVTENNVQVSQHFFALKLSKDDLVQVLKGLQNASVVTDPTNPQIVNNGGPANVQSLVSSLSVKSTSASVINIKLSSGIEFISKPSQLHVPPWQMISALLGGVPLRTATWWADPEIPSTTTAGAPGCWSSTLGTPGPVDIATTGHWSGKEFGLTGGLGTDFNNAKLGVSTSPNEHYAVFGDLDQQGSLSGGNCGTAQNGRGGVFYVVPNPQLQSSITALIAGSSAVSGRSR